MDFGRRNICWDGAIISAHAHLTVNCKYPAKSTYVFHGKNVLCTKGGALGSFVSHFSALFLCQQSPYGRIIWSTFATVSYVNVNWNWVTRNSRYFRDKRLIPSNPRRYFVDIPRQPKMDIILITEVKLSRTEEIGPDWFIDYTVQQALCLKTIWTNR